MMKPMKRRKTDVPISRDRNNSLDTSDSEANSRDSSIYDDETWRFSTSSAESVDEEYIPEASSGPLSDESQQYFPATRRERDTSTPDYIPASKIVFKSSPREYLERSISPSSEESSRSSSSGSERERYSDQEDVATEIVGTPSPDEFRAGLVNPSGCNQQFSSSVVNNVVQRINELKRTLPDGESGKSRASYVTQTFELRGAITTVAEQLSTSRQMEKSLKNRLKSYERDNDELRSENHRFKREVRKLRRVIAEKDDLINNKDMEIFVLKNDLELAKRAQLKAEDERKQLEMFSKAQSQYYAAFFPPNQQQGILRVQGPGPRPRMNNPVLGPMPSRPMLNNPNRFKYFAPNYKFSKTKVATDTKSFLAPGPVTTLNDEKGTSRPNFIHTSTPPVSQQCSASAVNESNDVEKADLETPQLLKPSSPSSETGNEDSTTSRPDSPVELIISAEEEDSDEDVIERFRFR